MDNPPKVTPGDLVRVVLEGAVVRVWLGGTGGFLLGARQQNLIIGSDKHVVSIEVLAKPAKVGDTFRPALDIARTDALPNRTVLRQDETGSLSAKCDGQWYPIGASEPYAPRYMNSPCTIVYLPE